jgi:PAS domain S-box-containing protein
MKTPLRVLMIEDVEDDALLMVNELECNGFHPLWERVDTPEATEAALHGQGWDVILCDYNLPCFTFRAALQLLQALELDIPFILVSGTIGEEVAVEAMKGGAHDYVMKDRLTRLVPAIERELREAAVRREHRRVEQALGESDRCFRQLAENIHQVFYLSNGDISQMLYISPAYEEIWARSCQSLYEQPRSFLDTVHPEDRPRVLASLSRQVGGDNTEEEYRLLRSDGSLRWIWDRSFPIKDQSGRVARIAGIAEDITARKQAEEGQARLATLLEATPDFVGITDLQGRVLYVNPAGRRMVGLGQDEDVSCTTIADYHPGWAIAIVVKEALPAAIRDGVWRGEAAFLSRLRPGSVPDAASGREIPVSMVIMAHKDPGGAVQFLATISRDITERKRAENRQRAEHAVARVLAESVSPEEAAAKILQAICESLGWNVGTLWTVDGTQQVLRCIEVWHKPCVHIPEFAAASREHQFAMGVGLPGRVWASGQPAWIADVVQDVHCLRAPVAAREGLHAAFAFPIRIDTNVLAVMEFFSAAIHEPDTELLEMMATIGSQIGQFIERRRAEVVLHARQREFSLARTIQQGLIPQAPPVLPGFEIAGASYPAQETGGDYFDYIPMAEGQWGIALGDASGHGIGPALLIAETRAYVRALATPHTDPGQVLHSVNQHLVEDITTDNFVTLFLGRLDPLRRSLVYSSGGHTSGYVLDGRGEVKLILPSTSLPLALDPTADFPNGPAVRLEPGDLVFLLSDGIVEQPASDRSQFGIGRALEVVRAHRHASASDIVAALVHEVRAWSPGPPVDDMTAIVVATH